MIGSLFMFQMEKAREGASSCLLRHESLTPPSLSDCVVSFTFLFFCFCCCFLHINGTIFSFISLLQPYPSLHC